MYGRPAAMAASVLRAILPDLVLGRRGTMITSLKLATGPIFSRTFAITSLATFARDSSTSENLIFHRFNKPKQNSACTKLLYFKIIFKLNTVRFKAQWERNMPVVLHVKIVAGLYVWQCMLSHVNAYATRIPLIFRQPYKPLSLLYCQRPV